LWHNLHSKVHGIAINVVLLTGSTGFYRGWTLKLLKHVSFDGFALSAYKNVSKKISFLKNIFGTFRCLILDSMNSIQYCSV
jgi:hypothetical protein